MIMPQGEIAGRRTAQKNDLTSGGPCGRLNELRQEYPLLDGRRVYQALARLTIG